MYKGKDILRIVTVAVSVVCCTFFQVSGQSTDALGSYSPYSVFGIGKMSYQGSAYNQMMGGIGIGMRDNGVINTLNPASITARDTLSFMLDFGVNQQNLYNRDKSTNSAYNVFNMQNVAFTFPIYKKSAFIVGIAPFSDIGYKFLSTETSTDVEADIGDVKYQKYGTGSIYQLFAGAAVTLFDRVSVGAQAIYYFGAVNKHNDVLFNSSDMYNTISTGWDYKVHCFSGKFGIQYIQPIRKYDSELVIGATYRLGNDLRGDVVNYAFTGADTVVYNTSGHTGFDIADEFGAGISYRAGSKWAVGVDFVQQNWRNCKFPDSGMWPDFNPANARYYRAGFEITPNQYDIRYYMRRVTYRAGMYFEQSYVTVGGAQVNSFGLTFGASFPIYRWHNAVSFAVDIGQRGSLRLNQVRERYINFILNINLHDIWFVKYRYD
ncbi:MAG TPA: hypothetical protein IAC04_03135 [Candidatus Coprenecus stercoravium]|uniref:Long-chain fatty acid transport protein n=1 Tax=Candidatus Coprenecus stercoravium TaxID=2840735 RepID=A0A9D2GQM8_9BACT|nr:hypothetical protein [Candidatus Coprenecus stercoravium]